MFFYNRKKFIHWIDNCNWNSKLTQYLWKKGWIQVLDSRKNITLENTRSLQRSLEIMTVPLKYMATSEIWLNRNICQIHCIWAIYGYKCFSKKYCFHRGIVGRHNFREIKKHSSLKKKLFPLIKYSNLQGKNFFLRTNTLFWNTAYFLNCYFFKIFVHLSVIAVLCYFSVYKLIGWDPANIY